MNIFPGADNQLKQPGGTVARGYEKKLVLHTTEGSSWPNYDGNAPHLTVKWSGTQLDVRQHIPLSMAARALKNPRGGVETNRGGAIQVEIVGTCDPNSKVRPFWPAATDEMLTELGFFIRQLCAGTSVDVNARRPNFISYPNSYANGGRQRFTAGEWVRFNGICGHQHVPENSHGDPGSLNVARALLLSAPVAIPVVPIRKKASTMFVAKYGSTRYRLVTGDRYLGITEELAIALQSQGVPFVGIGDDDNAALSTLISEAPSE